MQNVLIFHLIGIGGISMSAIAELLQADGFIVQGSDNTCSDITKRLEKKGIKVFYSHNSKNVENADVVVYSSAIGNDNVELRHARDLAITTISRGEMLGRIAKEYKNVISISGAHGKTTTTGFIANIFQTAGFNPTFHVGGELVKSNSNVHVGNKEYFITEACEYKDNFLYLKNTVGIILNIEAEHLDYFKSYENVLNSFFKFAQNSNVVICPNTYMKLENCYGQEFSIKNKKQNKDGKYSFDIYRNNKKFLHLKLNIPFEYNIFNAFYAAVCSTYFNIDPLDIKLGIESFKGVKRRFEITKYKDINVVYDYAHHPTQVKKVISALKAVTNQKIFVIFQPHTYSRTYDFMEQFIDALSIVDNLAIFKTYPAREEEIIGGRAYDLFQNLNKNGQKCVYFEDIEYLSKIISELSADDYLLILGAGDIYNIVNSFLKNS